MRHQATRRRRRKARSHESELLGRKKAARFRAAGLERGRAYWPILYVLSPASFLLDSTVRPIFLATFPLMKPLMEWFCQSVTLAISAMVAPLGRRRRSRTTAFFENSRGGAASFGLEAGLLAALGSFFDAFLPAGLLPFFAPLWLLGAPLFWPG